MSSNNRAPYFIIVAAALTVSCICAPGAYADVDTAGKATIDKIVNLFSVWHGKGANQAVFNEAAMIIDYDEMSQKALGSYWDKLKSAERTEFVHTFRRLIEERYYKRWHKIFNRAELSYHSESPAGGDLFISTGLQVGKKQDKVVWRLSKSSGSYKIISISVNQKDLLDRLSSRLEQRLRKDSFNHLLAWMREEAEMEDDDV